MKEILGDSLFLKTAKIAIPRQRREHSVMNFGEMFDKKKKIRYFLIENCFKRDQGLYSSFSRILEFQVLKVENTFLLKSINPFVIFQGHEFLLNF